MFIFVLSLNRTTMHLEQRKFFIWQSFLIVLIVVMIMLVIYLI